MWYLNQLNKTVRCDESIDEEDELPVQEPSDATTDSQGTTLENTDEGAAETSPKPEINPNEKDIQLVSVTCHTNQPSELNSNTSSTMTPASDQFNSKFNLTNINTKNNGSQQCQNPHHQTQQQHYLVTPNTRPFFLSRSIATSIILDLSPSIVSVSSQNECVFLDSLFDALKRVLHLLVKSHEIPTQPASSTSAYKPTVLTQKVFVSVIAYTPFVVAKNNQVLVQNRRISSANLDQVMVEIWICLNRLTQELHELVAGTCGMNLNFDASNRSNGNVFVFPQTISGGVIRHPGSVLEDIYELGIFSSSLMPRLSRLSLIIISDGLFASTNNLNIFRLKSIAVSFISLGAEVAYPDSCFGYMPYIDLMRFTAKTTLGVYLSHQDLINFSQSLTKSKQIPLLNNPLHKLFCWTIHSEMNEDQSYYIPHTSITQRVENNANLIEMNSSLVAKHFCADQPPSASSNYNPNFGLNSNCSNNHDWRQFRQLERHLDADFEQVLSCLLREGYLIKSIHFKHKETSWIIARLVLHWRHNLDLEQELTATYWNQIDPFDLSDNNQLILRPFNGPIYGDTYCQIIVHGSYCFLHNLYCDRRTARRRSEYRDIAYRQFRQLIDSVLQTHEQLQYLSRFYRDSSLSKVPSFLLHGNSLFYELPHSNRLTSTNEHVLDETKTSEFQAYWQKISCLDTRNWKNLMHIHTLRLVLEHDQPKHKNIHCQGVNGRYTHVQCRRALSAISTFIKSYSSFALLEDTTYIKFIYNKDDDLREIETSATKGFIVIRINKLLPILVIYLMFTSGILDSHRVQIVSYLEDQLTKCKLRNTKTSMTQLDNLLKTKTILPSSESCCVQIKSPLERMLKVYSRNFINDFLIHNWSHGLPGSCPYNNMQQSYKVGDNTSIDAVNHTKSTKVDGVKEQFDGQASSDSSINRYNLVFGKYLYGVRVVQTINNLPHDVVPLLAANVLSRISALLVNFRIKQGFHIAFNNSGILNLVVELLMQDQSNEEHSSSCLCQYVVFPPTVTNCVQVPNLQNSMISGVNQLSAPVGSGINGVGGGSSKPTSLAGSLTNSDSFMRGVGGIAPQVADCSSNPYLRDDNGEVRVIREYWIEQQYGVSANSEHYHQSLQDLRYSEVVDHLFITDSSIFECLLSYDILQLLCDKLSPYHEMDSALNKSNSKQVPPFSPTNSIDSSDIPDNSVYLDNSTTILPSTFIDGSAKDNCSKVPLIELEYKFSIVKFLDYCQQASLNVLLFKSQSEFYKPLQEECDLSELGCQQMKCCELNQPACPVQQPVVGTPLQHLRKMSIDLNEFEAEHPKREHRSSYQHDNLSVVNSYVSPIYSASINHLFLEILHKRLKQMHDKELKLSDYDRRRLTVYLKKRKILSDQLEEELMEQEKLFGSTKDLSSTITKLSSKLASEEELTQLEEEADELLQKNKTVEPCRAQDEELLEWRCFLRKGNQENLMIVLVPATLSDITRWLKLANSSSLRRIENQLDDQNYDPVCPIFVFRCSSTMVNEHILSYLNSDNGNLSRRRTPLEADLSMHFGQPCYYMGQSKTSNDELKNESSAFIRFNVSNSSTSDEKASEALHFKAFLRKVKNTVLKARFSALNDAYLSELFVHKDDILYYINYVGMDIQKKYHVSTQLRSLAEFIKNYDEYNDALPKKQGKPRNKMLNSILLQKCGLFINQPIARFNESNPIIKQLNDRKLLFLMRCNYKIELPILDESLNNSTLLKSFVRPLSGGHHHQHHHSHHHHHHLHPQHHHQAQQFQHNSSIASNSPASGTGLTTVNGGTARNKSSSISESVPAVISNSVSNTQTASSMSKVSLSENMGVRLSEMDCGSTGATSNGSPGALLADRLKTHHQQHHTTAPRLGFNSNLANLSNSLNDSFILEAFRGSKCCSIKEVPIAIFKDDVSLRHEAHMAEVLRRTGERKESHHYRRVLKSKGNYNQSHSAIDQALKRVDSLGRLEHFCLTPLLFSPSWRSKLAPVRDHTIESGGGRQSAKYHDSSSSKDQRQHQNEAGSKSEVESNADNKSEVTQEDEDDLWHQMVCNNYIKEYEQYIQTLGFNSVQIRYQSGGKASSTSAVVAGSSQATSSFISGAATSFSGKQSSGTRKSSRNFVHHPTSSSFSSFSKQSGRGSTSTSAASLITSSNQTSATGTYNTGYLIKFLNSGCLVFKVGFCKPYVYSILYSIEGGRFNNNNMKLNMTAFLDELDNIKVTMHLHSFTYDYHLRSMYSYISGRQLTFSPGYHLISFLDNFRKYYQKAPNYARNHILCGEVSLANLRVSGQQLYNYIVTHNQAYNMEVLEMSSSLSDLLNSVSSRSTFKLGEVNEKQLQHSQLENLNDESLANQDSDTTRSHANDYVLIELKREKVRYRDGKDPDVFDCGLLITHDVHQQQTSSSKNCLTLKYFLLLTNQRDLYPKLIHTYDNIISSGCHRPIRLGVAQQKLKPVLASAVASTSRHQQTSAPRLDRLEKPQHKTSTTTAPSSGQSDADDFQSSELQSSGELSGPQSIVSTANSVQSSSSGLQFGNLQTSDKTSSNSSQTGGNKESAAINRVDVAIQTPRITIEKSETEVAVAAESLRKNPKSNSNLDSALANDGSIGAQNEVNLDASAQLVSLSPEESSFQGRETNTSSSPTSSAKRKRAGSTNSSSNNTGAVANKISNQERTICDEEITYLGYFSSDEMDMLRFLQEKTANLRAHIERTVRDAETHYRRDYLWHKLMQRQTSNQSTKSDELPLTVDELSQLLAIVQAVDLSSLDNQLTVFTTMHINWYAKLLKAFADLKQSNSPSQHQIYTVKASKILLLYIDPKCTAAFILLTIDLERQTVELNMLLKDKQECAKIAKNEKGDHDAGSNQRGSIELDSDCQQLINDFINFCAAFMWSTFLN